MLLELSIRNFAIIDELSITLSRGLNVLSGETGAGKSIIINAVNLILGDRAQHDLIRTGAEEAVVEAMFSLPEKNPIHEILEEKGIEGFKDNLIIKRVISRGGKNRIYINGSLSNLTNLSEVGEELINISGQHEHQTLLRPERHIDIIDSFGGTYPQRIEVSKMIKRISELTEKLKSLQINEEDKAKKEDFLRFQINEIEQAKLKPNDDEELKTEMSILSNSEKLFKKSEEASSLLYSMEGSASEKIGSALQMVKDISAIDPELKHLMESLDSALYAAEDAGKDLEGYASRVSFDPERLNEIQEKLRLIGSLKKKYGATVSDILSFAEKAKEELSGMERNEERIGELEGEINSLKEKTLEMVLSLSQARKKASDLFSSSIENEVSSLGMGGTNFIVDIKRTEAGPEDDINLGGFLTTPKGIDKIEFLISPNVGEEPRPLARIASGGELSRIMLVMKKILAQTQVIPTLIFDEVDSGIGGGIAQVVGKKLKDVSAHQQVICITHLPQIAGYGDTHYSVVKETRSDRAVTRVERLSQDERIMEIARMLGGEKITDTTLRHAREMIESSK